MRSLHTHLRTSHFRVFKAPPGKGVRNHRLFAREALEKLQKLRSATISNVPILAVGVGRPSLQAQEILFRLLATLGGRAPQAGAVPELFSLLSDGIVSKHIECERRHGRTREDCEI